MPAKKKSNATPRPTSGRGAGTATAKPDTPRATSGRRAGAPPPASAAAAKPAKSTTSPAKPAKPAKSGGAKSSSAGATLSTRELNRALLARQLLLERAKLDVVSAVERVGGLQAQERRPPFIALWSRLDSFDRETLRAALTAKRVVRATLMRATLHMVSAADFLAWRGPLGPALLGGALAVLRDRAKGVDVDDVIARGHTFLAAKPAAFDDIRAHLAKPGDDERALGYIARTGLPLVQLPTADTWGFDTGGVFALSSTWLGKDPAPGDDASTAALIMRYLAAFGPASVADAQTWSSLRNLKPVFDALRPRLVTFTDGKRELFDVPDAPRPSADVAAPVRFLPDFDSAVLAHDVRSRIIDDAHRPLLTTRNLRVRATFLVDGFVAGFWKIERKAKTATLAMEPLAKLDKKTRGALEIEGARLLQFAEADAKDHVVTLG